MIYRVYVSVRRLSVYISSLDFRQRWLPCGSIYAYVTRATSLPPLSCFTTRIGYGCAGSSYLRHPIKPLAVLAAKPVDIGGSLGGPVVVREQACPRYSDRPDHAFRTEASVAVERPVPRYLHHTIWVNVQSLTDPSHRMFRRYGHGRGGVLAATDVRCQVPRAHVGPLRNRRTQRSHRSLLEH